MKSVWTALLLGYLLLFGGVLSSDEDCVEGEEGCEAQEHAQSTPMAEAHNDIYILTDENFAEVVKKEEMIMATFYAPWSVLKTLQKSSN